MKIHFIMYQSKDLLSNIWFSDEKINYHTNLTNCRFEKFCENLTNGLFTLELFSFLNGLSYRCQIGPKWKLFWSTFWEKLNRQTFFEFWMHLVNWKSILQTIYPKTTKSFMFGRITLFKNRCLCFSPKTTSKYLSFETNLGSVAQTVQKWERFKEKFLRWYKP